MAKIRIYELARDLNMKNKDLLEKIRSMDITVRSHMSSLDDQQVAKIKADLFGRKPETVEVTRIKPTIIRRRKKVIPKEPAPVEESKSDAPAETPVEAISAPEKEITEARAVSDAEASAPKTDLKEAHEIVDQISAVAPVEAKEKEIVAEPTEETPAEAAVDVQSDEVQEQEPASLAENASAPASDEPASEVETQQPSTEPITATPEKEVEEKAVREKITVLKDVRPVKKIKKGKEETPARIIKLGEPRPAKPTKEPPKELDKIATQKKPSAKLKVVPEPPKPEPSKKKKKKEKLKAEDGQKDKKFLKKKITFRRKEIVEGADLYTKRALRTRKSKKTGKPTAAKGQATQITTAKAIKRRIKVDEAIVLSDLAKRMGVKASEIIQKLMAMGVMVTVNQTIDYETAALVASEFDYEVEKAAFEEEAIIKAEADDPSKLAPRAPVVTIMGHVDHGKTSLLDVIRKTRITALEAGGITQHIGAYHVSMESGQICFLDTPGHEAFTAMRARGAKVTDIVVLVVAADDGVMPQTVEAINHARASDVPIIVAVNKIDKANADPDRVQRELAEHGLVPEDWGGDTIFVKVSAKQNIGIDDLLEMILLQSEVLELKANPEKLAIGHVIEAKLDSGRGSVATVLIQEGTLHTGDSVVCGVHYGKLRAMIDDRGLPVDSAGPSIPVEILGLTGVPMAGDELVAVADEKDAKQVSAHRTQKLRSKELARTSRMSLEGLFEKMKEGEVKELSLIIKADVDGSIEALRDSLVKLSNEEVKINVIHSATGTITESDVSLAEVSNAIIIGFNVRPNTKVMEMAQEENVDMRFHNIIYNVIKEVKNAIVGLMASVFEERIIGRAEVRDVFHVPKVGAIAGCYVNEGKIERGLHVRLLRDGIIRYEGKISSLRRYKDDVKEVNSGYECGVGIENYNDIKIGDTIDCYFMEEIKPEID